ncbi:hypothetical protein ACFQXA_34825 [Nocardiopsis composta]
MSQFAPPTRAHVWARYLVMRAIGLPGVRGAFQRSVQRSLQRSTERADR